jgi:hypothetical protein
MWVKTGLIHALLTEKGYTRDKNDVPYTWVCYRGEGQELLVIDDTKSEQDTDMLIEDCVANESYDMAAGIKAIADKLHGKESCNT